MGEVTNGIVWTFGALAFIFDLSEEIASDAMDVQGDEQRSTLSVARVRGKTYALRVSSLFYALFVLISAVPFVMDWFSSIYLVAFVPMDIALVYWAMRLVQSQTIEEGLAIIRQLYLIITVFCVGVVIGSALYEHTRSCPKESEGRAEQSPSKRALLVAVPVRRPICKYQVLIFQDVFFPEVPYNTLQAVQLAV